MNNFNNQDKKKNTKVTATTTFLLLATILVVAAGASSTPLTALGSRTGFTSNESDFVVERPKAPTVVSGDNVYIAWWTNNTENGNEEVMFRASNDGGATFGDKINLSNTTEADSWRVEVAGEGADVVVSWWETNQTSDIPVARVSTDGGATFGPMLMLGMNGTLGSGEVEGGEGEG